MEIFLVPIIIDLCRSQEHFDIKTEKLTDEGELQEQIERIVY